MKIKEISKLLGYDILGCEERDISSIKYIDEADINSIAVAFNKKDIEKAQSNVVLTEPKIITTEKTLIYCCEPVEIAMVKISKILIKNGCLIDYSLPIQYKNLMNNILIGENVNIGEKTVVDPFVTIGNDVIIGENCHIESGVHIGSGTVIGDNTIIHSGSKISASAFYHFYDENLESFVGVGKVIIGNNVEIGYNTTIQRGTLSDTVIKDCTFIGNLIDIGHDVKIGTGCKIVSQTGIAGNVKIGNNVKIFGQVGISNYVTIGNGAIVMAKSIVSKNIQAYKKVSGNFGREHMEELRIQAKIRKFNNE